MWLMRPLMAPNDKGGSGNSDSDKGSAADKADTNNEPESDDKGRIYRQTDLDTITNRVRKTEQDKAASDRQKLLDRIAALESKDMSEQDKAIQKAVAKVNEEWGTKYNTLKAETDLKDGLLEKGVQPRHIRAALALRREFAPDGDLDATVKALKEQAPHVFTGAKFGPGDGGNHDDKSTRGTGWTPAKVDKATEGMTSQEFDAFMAKHGKDIEEDSRKISSVRVFEPGQAMTPTAKE